MTRRARLSGSHARSTSTIRTSAFPGSPAALMQPRIRPHRSARAYARLASPAAHMAPFLRHHAKWVSTVQWAPTSCSSVRLEPKGPDRGRETRLGQPAGQDRSSLRCAALAPGSQVPGRGGRASVRGLRGGLVLPNGRQRSRPASRAPAAAHSNRPGLLRANRQLRTDQVCSLGTVAPFAEMGACTKCAAGKYQADEGEQVCIACGHWKPLSSNVLSYELCQRWA